MHGYPLNKKVWDIRVNARIGEAITPSCSLRCLAIKCEEAAHPRPVSIVIYHLLGAGPVRRIGGDLVLDTRATRSHSEKEKIVRLEGEYFCKFHGEETRFSGAGSNSGETINDVRSGRASIALKIFWQSFGSGPGPPVPIA